MADTITFSFDKPSASSVNQFSGSGTLTVEEQSTGVYLVTGIAGTIAEGSKVGSGSTVAIASLIAPGLQNGNDNLIYDPADKGKFFTQQGLAFTLADGSIIDLYKGDAKLYENAAHGSSQFSEGLKLTASADIPSTPSVPTAAAPEPNSLMLVGTGILGLAGLVRRKVRS
ncbi:MAG TPA: PEP-CTERM sorting domain-containing protein [Granulicella sp.]